MDTLNYKWEKFAESGSIIDYLDYCKFKNLTGFKERYSNNQYINGGENIGDD